MSVRTTADEKISEAKEKIKEAKILLEDAIDEDTWGHDSFSDSYMEEIEDAITLLRQVKRKI